MNQIICSLEEWDSIIDYYRPNGSSKTWYIKEKRMLDIPTMWGSWNILSESNEIFDQGIFKTLVTPHYSNNLKYTPYNEISDQKHLYFINVFNSSYFVNNFEIGFRPISEKYKNDIRLGNAKIVIFYLFEGYSGTKDNQDLEIIERWRIESKFPENSIYFICGNLIISEIIKQKNLGFIGIPFHNFEGWNPCTYDNIIDYEPIDNKYLFLSYNRNYRDYRIQFILDLLEKNVFQKGLVSLKKYGYVFPEDANPEHVNFINENSPFLIDDKHDLNYNLAINLSDQDYKRTFISVVCETLVDEDSLFFSEKIWKPIMIGHPFMVLGSKNSLAYLKSLGYKTYDKWIDERYDSQSDSKIRSKLICGELSKFSEKSVEELKNIRLEMREVCEYNQNHFKKLYKENYDNGVSGILSNILDKIWNNLIEQ